MVRVLRPDRSAPADRSATLAARATRLDDYAVCVDSRRMSGLMTETVATTILALDRSGGASLTELARATARPVSTVQRAVEGLLKTGVVIRPTSRGPIRLAETVPRQALRELAEWRLAASVPGSVADRAELRRLMALDDREREAYFLASNRNMLRMFAGARLAR